MCKGFFLFSLNLKRFQNRVHLLRETEPATGAALTPTVLTYESISFSCFRAELLKKLLWAGELLFEEPMIRF